MAAGGCTDTLQRCVANCLRVYWEFPQPQYMGFYEQTALVAA